MKTKCYSVKLESLISISDKAYLARSFNGNEDIIPKSQYFGRDYDSTKSEAHWISAWILDKKTLQYSTKKERCFDETGKMLPSYNFEKHIPKKVSKKTKIDENLIR